MAGRLTFACGCPFSSVAMYGDFDRSLDAMPPSCSARCWNTGPRSADSGEKLNTFLLLWRESDRDICLTDRPTGTGDFGAARLSLLPELTYFACSGDKFMLELKGEDGLGEEGLGGAFPAEPLRGCEFSNKRAGGFMRALD